MSKYLPKLINPTIMKVIIVMLTVFNKTFVALSILQTIWILVITIIKRAAKNSSININIVE